MWGGAPDRWTPTPAARPAPHRTAPGRWAADGRVEPDRAEPTDGRHAFDRDAALTPIFTSLRRGAGRRPRTGAPPLRLAPAPMDDHRSDPPTSPLPVVPALHALDPYPTGGYGAASIDPHPTGGWAPVDPEATGGYPAVRAPHPPAGHRATSVDPFAGGGYRHASHPPAPVPPNETTTVWRLTDDPMAYSPTTDTGRHHRRLAPAGW
jgi:hypothetical protein